MAETQSRRRQSSLLPEHLKDLLIEKFVKDAVTESAVDQAGHELQEHGLLPLFARYFGGLLLVDQQHPDVLRYPDDGSACPEPNAHEHAEQLDNILRQFYERMTSTEPRSGVRASEPESPNALLTIYSHSIFEAARYNPRVSPLALRKSNMDPFLSSLTKSPVLSRLQELSVPRRERCAAIQDQDVVSFRNLKQALDDATTESMFTCGGSLNAYNLADSLMLRFDHGDGQTARIGFPLLEADSPGFGRLLTACQQATFGFQGEDVLDSDYRRALKLDPAKFSINFHPSDHGIIETIANTMLPWRAAGHILRADLYKLNIYETSGVFKAHVDTPRSTTHIASLVVCLPMQHTGGELVVRHGGKEACYNWAESSNLVQWAAFFSDCEHEVLEVRSGNRVTLTYNIHVIPANLDDEPSGLHMKSLPVFEQIRSALFDPGVLPHGGLLGFHCLHHYARNRYSSPVNIASRLKGVDRVVFQAFHKYGLYIGFGPVLTQEDVHEIMEGEEDYPLWSSEEERDEGSEKASWPHEFEDLLTRVKASPSNFEIPYIDAESIDQSHFSTFQERLTHILSTRKIAGLALPRQRMQNNVFPDRVGVNVNVVDFPDGEYGGYNDLEEVFENWPKVHNINWLNSQTGRDKDLAMAYIKYGNQAELEHHYASIAILARVPPYGADARPAQERATGDE